MSADPNVVLYGWGMFEPAYSAGLSNQQQVQLVAGSGFTTVILWTLHPKLKTSQGVPSLVLNYNDPEDPLVTDGVFNPKFQYLAQQISALKSTSGSTVTRVLFGIGSADNPDFQNVQTLMGTPVGTELLRRSFQAIVDNLPIDGFDLDFEDLTYSTDEIPTLAKFTLLLAALRSKASPTRAMVVTWCPYSSAEEFWYPALAEVYAQNGSQQAVGWLNLQCYAGGSWNDPGNWASGLATYQQKTRPAGVTDTAAFVVPGLWCVNPGSASTCVKGQTSGSCPSDIQAQFASYAASDEGINGGFIWNSFDVFRCMQSGVCSSMAPRDYAQAVIKGLGAGQPGS